MARKDRMGNRKSRDQRRKLRMKKLGIILRCSVRNVVLYYGVQAGWGDTRELLIGKKGEIDGKVYSTY